MGRLVEYKRVDLLLRLWERVRPVTGGRLVIVGRRAGARSLQQMAGPGVEFAGHVCEAEKHRLLCAPGCCCTRPPWRGGGWSSPRRPPAGRPRSASTSRGFATPSRTGSPACSRAGSPRSPPPGARWRCPPSAGVRWARPPRAGPPTTAGPTRCAAIPGRGRRGVPGVGHSGSARRAPRRRRAIAAGRGRAFAGSLPSKIASRSSAPSCANSPTPSTRTALRPRPADQVGAIRSGQRKYGRGCRRRQGALHRGVPAARGARLPVRA